MVYSRGGKGGVKRYRNSGSNGRNRRRRTRADPSKTSVSATDRRLFERYGKLRAKLRRGGQVPAPPAVSQPNYFQRNFVMPVQRGYRENIAKPFKRNIADPFKRNVGDPFRRNVATPINKNIIQPGARWTRDNVISPG